MDSIKTQLEAYDEQLQNIDIQISEAMSRELKKEDEEKKSNDTEPKTREELLNERMNNVAAMSSDAEHIDTLDSVKSSVDGRIKVLESEIDLDNGRFEGASGASDYKKNTLSDLKKKSAEISADINSRMAALAEEVSEERRQDPAEASEEADSDKDPTDPMEE